MSTWHINRPKMGRLKKQNHKTKVILNSQSKLSSQQERNFLIKISYRDFVIQIRKKAKWESKEKSTNGQRVGILSTRGGGLQRPSHRHWWRLLARKQLPGRGKACDWLMWSVCVALNRHSGKYYTIIQTDINTYDWQTHQSQHSCIAHSHNLVKNYSQQC